MEGCWEEVEGCWEEVEGWEVEGCEGLGVIGRAGVASRLTVWLLGLSSEVVGELTICSASVVEGRETTHTPEQLGVDTGSHTCLLCGERGGCGCEGGVCRCENGREG